MNFHETNLNAGPNKAPNRAAVISLSYHYNHRIQSIVSRLVEVHLIANCKNKLQDNDEMERTVNTFTGTCIQAVLFRYHSEL